MAVENIRHNSPARWLDGFFLLRPTLIFPLWTILLCGHALVAEPEILSRLQWLSLSVAMSSLFGLVYLINQMRDREGDLHNQKSLLTACDLVSRRTQLFIGIALGILAPVGLILAGFGDLLLWMIATFVVAGILYNYTPIALEKSPIGGLISGVVGAWLLLQLGELTGGYDVGILPELPYVLAFTAGCLLTSLPDIAGDRLSGKQSFAVRYGERKTIIAAGLMVLIAGGLGVIGGDLIILAPAVACLVYIFLALKRKDYSLSVAANKSAIFLLALGIAIQYPYFLLAMALYLPLAKWYHLSRFGLDYPNFRAEYASQLPSSHSNGNK